MQFIDTHCHIHDEEFFNSEENSLDRIVSDARGAGVSHMLCVGTDVRSSKSATKVSQKYDELYCSVALHPHEAEKLSYEEIDSQMLLLKTLLEQKKGKIVAIGECGLDYFYHKDPSVKEKQAYLLRRHLEIGVECDLPFIFHVRDAKLEAEKGVFADFFKVLDDFPLVRGVMHSFSDNQSNMQTCVDRGLYIGLNGIMTFTSDRSQLEAAKAVPLTHLLLETDAPFLTPKPFRGKMCKPQHVVETAKFLSELRSESLSHLAEATTHNAKQLFTIK